MRKYFGYASIALACLLGVGVLALQPVLCHKVWSDHNIASRYSWIGCEINENDGKGWKSEWDYRSQDPKMPALRAHFHSNNFGGYWK